MKYKGKLYGKLDNNYFDTSKTSTDWHKLENDNLELSNRLIAKQNAIAIRDSKILHLENELHIFKRKISDTINDIEINTHALGCGLEDLNIVDRYDAMRYGIEQMLDMCLNAIDLIDDQHSKT